ncbi:hypothetical protein HDU97_002831 [Phlyctochytrium planicorne]|nr:hypothetical protein HDU97_002831 [Phlyctochytrium planicorne]
MASRTTFQSSRLHCPSSELTSKQVRLPTAGHFEYQDFHQPKPSSRSNVATDQLHPPITTLSPAGPVYSVLLSDEFVSNNDLGGEMLHHPHRTPEPNFTATMSPNESITEKSEHSPILNSDSRDFIDLLVMGRQNMEGSMWQPSSPSTWSLEHHRLVDQQHQTELLKSILSSFISTSETTRMGRIVGSLAQPNDMMASIAALSAASILQPTTTISIYDELNILPSSSSMAPSAGWSSYQMFPSAVDLAVAVDPNQDLQLMQLSSSTHLQNNDIPSLMNMGSFAAVETTGNTFQPIPLVGIDIPKNEIHLSPQTKASNSPDIEQANDAFFDNIFPIIDPQTKSLSVNSTSTNTIASEVATPSPEPAEPKRSKRKRTTKKASATPPPGTSQASRHQQKILPKANIHPSTLVETAQLAIHPTKPRQRASAINPYVCPYPGCSLTYARKAHLASHAVSHSSIKNFVCEVCGFGFARALDLRRHRWTEHRVASTGDRGEEETLRGASGAGVEFLRCPDCNALCRRKESLARHRLNVCSARGGSVSS